MAILEDRIGIIDGPTGIMQKEAQLKINVLRKNITVIEGKIKELKNNKG